MLRLPYVTIALLIVVQCHAKEDSNGNELSLDSPPLKIDPKLRKALLKALTELENEEKTNRNDDIDLRDNEDDEDEDKSVEKTPDSSISVVTTTSIISGPAETTTSVEAETSKPIVIIQRSSGIQQKPIIHYVLPTEQLLDPVNETILTSASSSFSSHESKDLRSVNNPSKNQITDETSSKTKLGKENVETTTVTTTTSTEESEAKVEDVQFFSAPLVAAFTVHQDERGVPKSVVPIYKTTGHQVPSTQQQRLIQQQQEQEKLKNDEIQRQLGLQEKQKLLEQQLLKLQEQTKQQQSLLLKQQQYFQEQQFKLQKQYLENQQQTNNPIQLPSNVLTQSQSQQTNALPVHPQPFAPLRNTAQNAPNNLGNFRTTSQTPNHIGSFSHIQQTTVRPGVNQFNTNLIQKSISKPVNPVFNNPQPNLINFNNQATSQNFNNQATKQNFNNQVTHQNFNNQATNHNFNNHATNHNFKINQNQQQAVVSFQPSISFNPSQPLDQQRLQLQQQQQQQQQQHQQQQQSSVSPINQQLPIRSAVDFNKNPYYKPPSIHQLLTLTPPTQTGLLQPSLRQNQGNRIFRQEAGTGNFFGTNFNNNNNIGFHQQPQPQHQQRLQQSNRFFRSNDNNGFNSNPFGLQPPLINQQLNNLLYQSGINRGRPSEDLNIVSKILSYNVGGNDNHFGASGNSEKRVPAS